MQSFSQKAPDETWIVGMDFTAQLASGATISSCGASIEPAPYNADPNAASMLSGGAFLTGNTVSVTVAGGLSGTTYIVFFDATCSNGEILEAQASLSISTIKN